MSELRFHPAARAEAVAAAAYHETERYGYGERFEEELDRVLRRIQAFPESGTQLEGFPAAANVRVFRMLVFKYSVFIATTNGEPMVYAVAHQNREPGYWASRLG